MRRWCELGCVVGTKVRGSRNVTRSLKLDQRFCDALSGYVGWADDALYLVWWRGAVNRWSVVLVSNRLAWGGQMLSRSGVIQ